MKIIGINLSNNPNSINLKLLTKVIDNLGGEVIDFSLTDFPLFKPGIETPDSLDQLADKIKSADKIIFTTNEYNGSYSAFGKNLLDWISTLGSFDGSKKVTPLTGKHTFVMAAAPGPIGGLRAIPLTQTLLTELGCVIMGSFATTGGFNDNFDYTNVFKLTTEFKNK
ncbi:MAG: NADPH-dependent FMN reductase [Alphaproteobacteria bacterium]